MSDDIDRALERLSRQPVPGALAQAEIDVLGRIAALGPRLRELPSGFYLTAVAVALAIGIAGGLFTGQNPASDASLYPLAPASRLAPSSLLGG
ncbi:MAG TPA: hypothetical protein VJT70_08795 [Sphingomicrobium sp.]|jgi:ABC-type nitrate/sulfonate/bicarbonate transport system permease component|nr:hypothetical protein [Sphingomicrobium sp.]